MKGERSKNERMSYEKLMREMRSAESVYMIEKRKKTDINKKMCVKKREKAEKNWKRNKMKSWLNKRKIKDVDAGECVQCEKSDVELNLEDMIREQKSCRHDNTVAEIVTFGLTDSRSGNPGAQETMRLEREREKMPVAIQDRRD